MEEQTDQWASWLEVIIFIIVMFLFVVVGFSGIAWNILTLPEFSYWLTLLTFILGVAAGAIASYSFVSFNQFREVRSMMLMLLGLNIILWSFLFLVTHPSSVGWSVFSSRERNRTLAMAFVLIVVPTILLGSFTGSAKTTRWVSIILVVWGALILPLISLWFFLSPEPVFLMTSPDGGVEGLTLIGMIISMGYLIAQVIAAVGFMRKWWMTRNILDLSFMLALIHWITGTFFVIILWDPFQIAELIWVASSISGFLLIALVQFITSILYPHRALESLVDQRTRELDISKRETEFYLNMWSHKMGNLLQGVITYLDVLEHAAQHSEDDQRTRIIARDLSREATLVNHQVLRLTQIKDSFDQKLEPVDITSAIRKAVKGAVRLLGEGVFKIECTESEESIVRADENLDIVFQSIIFSSVRNRIDEEPVLSITTAQERDVYSISFTCRAKPILKEIEDYLDDDELIGQVGMDLDIFAMKILMIRYGGQIEYQHNIETQENTFKISLSKVR